MSLTRPEPTMTDTRGRPAWDPRRIAAYRKLRGIRAEELARRLGISTTYVSLLENGRRVPYIDANNAPKWLDAIEDLARYRDQMIADGIREMEALDEAEASMTTAAR